MIHSASAKAEVETIALTQSGLESLTADQHGDIQLNRHHDHGIDAGELKPRVGSAHDDFSLTVSEEMHVESEMGTRKGHGGENLLHGQ